MKKGEISNSLLTNFNCRYNHFVLGHNNIVYTIHLFRDFKVFKNLSYPFIIEGNLENKGTKFMLRRSDIGLIIFYELIESLITDYYSRFKYYIYKTIPETFNYIHQVEVRYINEDQCDFFVCFVFDHQIYLSEKELHEEIKFRKSLYKNIGNSLRKFEIFKIATAYTTINSNIELIWDILKNMKMIHKYTHLLANKVTYNGKILKKNLIINLKDNFDGSKFESIAKVNKCIITESETSKECIIELLFKNEKGNYSEFIKKKILIIIYEYYGYCTMYILYFFYNTQKNKEKFNYFQKVKNLELKKFKNIIENFNTKSYNGIYINHDDNTINKNKF